MTLVIVTKTAYTPKRTAIMVAAHNKVNATMASLTNKHLQLPSNIHRRPNDPL